ncbi:opine dehydrogenase [Kineosphaera limosa]|uniref:Opine dehydrogenase n=1 Tax=Kineosphaera limosa NBRC 100340 TaxID=1184609 RepID=K6W9A4_9MICO|nr:NAD/NADP-dependent octopine/nopaline dehydrogenase family protein [Kineosphaera limosa]NYE00046.1 opine dehydrogenase [Kineosphaera limosa]GAB95780.1 opine dehydrogenase [Kineosphaera limosa NBRC 100340]
MRVAIMGSGNGGTAAAFEWAQAGHEVSMWDFEQFDANIAAIAAAGSIEGRVKFEGTAPVRYAGHDLDRALEGAELVLIVGPAYAHEAMGEALRGKLSEDAAYCVLPSSCNGAVVLKQALGLDLMDDTYVIGETHTLPYGCRLVAPGIVRVTTRVLDGLFVAALPSSRTPELLTKLQVVWPQAEAAKNVLQTTLQNGNPVLHPAIMLLNASRIENTGGDFLFYTEGVTLASARLMEAVEGERQELGRVLGIDIVRDPELGLRQGYVSEATYLKGYNDGIGFAKSQAPKTLDFRYLTEDVPYGLVFMSELARQCDVPTPAIDTVISMASIILDVDFRAAGKRLPKDLGFADLTLEQVRGL